MDDGIDSKKWQLSKRSKRKKNTGINIMEILVDKFKYIKYI